MSDPVVEKIEGFPDAEEGEPEFIIRGTDEPEEPAEGAAAESDNVVLSRDEHAALVKKGSEAEALRAGVEKLGETIGRPINAPAVTPQQQPGENDDAFRARIEKELFEAGKTTGAIQEVAMRGVLPIVRAVLEENARMSKQLLLLDPERGPLYKRFKNEIEGELQAIPETQRMLPGAIDKAYARVIERHPELAEQSFEARVEARVAEELAKRGTAPAAAPAAVNATAAGGARGASTSSPKGKTVTVRLTEGERARFEREANEKSVPIEVILRKHGKIKEG